MQSNDNNDMWPLFAFANTSNMSLRTRLFRARQWQYSMRLWRYGICYMGGSDGFASMIATTVFK